LRPLQGAGKRSGLLHQRVRSRNWKTLWRFNTIARAGEPGGDTWAICQTCCAWARKLDHRQLRSRAEPDILGRGAGQAVMQVSRGTRGAALYSSSTLALHPDDGKLAWYFQHVQGETLDMDEVYERVLVDIATAKLCSPSAKLEFSGSWIARPANLSAPRKPSSRIFLMSTRKPAISRTARHSRAGNRQVDSGVPQHEAATTGRP